MERTNTDQKIRFKKTGGGSLRLGGKIYKPNQTFMAYPYEIPDAFKDVIVPVDPNAVAREEEKKFLGKTHEYTLKARSSGGYYDVVDSNGKVKNEKALRHAAALDLIRSLEE